MRDSESRIPMKTLSTATSVESNECPDHNSDTWDHSSSRVDSATRDHAPGGSGLLSTIKHRLPCNRCWALVLASVAITIFMVGGVLLIVALLVRHHDEQVDKLERSRSTVVSPPASRKAVDSGRKVTMRNPEIAQLIDFCASYPCLNGGTCLHEPNNSQCLCPAGYIQPVCDYANATMQTPNSLKSTPIGALSTSMLPQACDIRPCLNGGHCHPTGQCQCTGPYTGRYCQNYAKGVCASSPCMHNTMCREISGDYDCLCPSGFSGKRCEEIRCGSNATLAASAPLAFLMSPDYPNDGLPAMNCSWALTAVHFFVRLVVEHIHLNGSTCNDSYLDVYDIALRVLLKRYCPSNATASTFDTQGHRSIAVRYSAQPGSYFRLAYSSPDIDPCFYFNNANCMHGKCWPEATRATCVCDPCYRGIGCSEMDQGNCTNTFCANGGTCIYNCYVQTHRCLCPKEYDSRTNCAQRCADAGHC